MDSIPQKRCSKCKQFKDRNSENFGPSKQTSDGFRNVCKPCRHDEYEEALARNPNLHKDKYERFLQRPESIKSMKEHASVNRKRYYAQAREKGLCANCNAPSTKAFCDECQAKINVLNAANRTRLREEILVAYGGKCRCCGETTPEFLAIDHIFNDGKHQRKTVSSGLAMYTWLKKHGFPQDRYQLLCHNCNWGKRIYGVCPHQKDS